MLNSNIEFLSPATEKNNQRVYCFCGSSCTWRQGNYPFSHSNMLYGFALTWLHWTPQHMTLCAPRPWRLEESQECQKDEKECFKALEPFIILQGTQIGKSSPLHDLHYSSPFQGTVVPPYAWQIQSKTWMLNLQIVPYTIQTMFFVIHICFW